MARALFRYIVKDEGGNVIANAAVNLYRPGTTTAVYGTMYDSEVSGSAVTNPLTSTAQGEVIAWLDTAQLVDVNVTSNSSTCYFPKNPSARLSFATFTEGPLPVVPGSASTLAGVGVQPSCLVVENHSTAVGSFVVQSDNGEGHGTMGIFGIENNNPGPVDVNFRNAVVNIGSTDAAQTFYGGVGFNWQSPTGSTGSYIRCWPPGEANTSPVAFSVGVNGTVTMNVGGIASNAMIIAVRGDAQPRWKADENAKLYWGPGGSTAVDTTLERSAANVLSLGSDDVLKTGKNVTGSRPSAATVGEGAQFYDTTLHKPIWSDGTNWRDAAGTVV